MKAAAPIISPPPFFSSTHLSKLQAFHQPQRPFSTLVRIQYLYCLFSPFLLQTLLALNVSSSHLSRRCELFHQGHVCDTRQSYMAQPETSKASHDHLGPETWPALPQLAVAILLCVRGGRSRCAQSLTSCRVKVVSALRASCCATGRHFGIGVGAVAMLGEIRYTWFSRAKNQLHGVRAVAGRRSRSRASRRRFGEGGGHVGCCLF